PVPGEHAFGGDDQVGAKGRQGFEQGGRLAGDSLVEQLVAGLVEDAQVQRPGVQIATLLWYCAQRFSMRTQGVTFPAKRIGSVATRAGTTPCQVEQKRQKWSN